MRKARPRNGKTAGIGVVFSDPKTADKFRVLCCIRDLTQADMLEELIEEAFSKVNPSVELARLKTDAAIIERMLVRVDK